MKHEHLAVKNESSPSTGVEQVVGWRREAATEDAMKEQPRRSPKSAVNSFERELQAGDVLYSRWGEGQTNVDFYQIISIKGAFVEVREIAKRKVRATGWASEIVEPIPGQFVRQPIRRKVRQGNGILFESYIHIESYQLASRWDGRRLEQSHCA